MNGDEKQIWMEFVNGVSGGELTIEMLETAALELGRFQGSLYKQNEHLRRISCLGNVGFSPHD